MDRMMWVKPRITRDMRRNFIRLPFPEQAKLIGTHAKAHLEAAEEIVSKCLASPLKEHIKAVDIWEDMWRGKVQDEGMTNELDDLPQIDEAIGKIGEIFAATMSFWVYHYYSCDLDGKITPLSCLLSKARVFNQDEMAKIDEESGLRYLGRQMKYYASEVLCKNSLTINSLRDVSLIK